MPRYPFVLEKNGHSFRLSYNSSKRRWRLQEWNNQKCKKLREELILGQAKAQQIREAWMQELK